MPRRRKRTLEPIGPTNIPGEALDPRIIHEMIPPEEKPEDEHVESEQEQQARESEQALDRAATRTPPD
jgi:hypothetical protein